METLDRSEPGSPGDRVRSAGSPSQAAPPAPSGDDPLEGVAGLRDTIFDRLVGDENDVIGLLAYSLSMQNKRDWLAAFQSERGRDPGADEMSAYDIGERIERRLATYRKLAEHALSGSSFWASASLTPVSELPGPPSSGSYAASVPDAPPPLRDPPRRKGALGDAGGKLALAGGVFAILVVVALAARHMMGV